MRSKDYSSYSAKEFILDDSFKEWVKKPDSSAKEFWDVWLMQHPHKQATVAEAKSILLQLNFVKDEMPIESQNRIWKSLQALVEEDKTKSQGYTQPISVSGPPVEKSKIIRRWSYNTWYKAVAIFLALIVSSAIVFYLSKNQYVEHLTSYGETKEIRLPDGSTVILSANTSLQHPSDWNDRSSREVWLKGEAFFSVVKKPGQPTSTFIVHADNLNVEVLGTQFNVNNRRGKAKVVLNTGSVKLETTLADEKKQIVMEPGEFVEFSKETKTFTKKRVDPHVYSSWTQNKLVFDNTSLKEIAQLLEDNYGLSITFQDASVAERKFTATIPSGNINTLLTALSESFGISIQKEGNHIIIQ